MKELFWFSRASLAAAFLLTVGCSAAGGGRNTEVVLPSCNHSVFDQQLNNLVASAGTNPFPPQLIEVMTENLTEEDKNVLHHPHLTLQIFSVRYQQFTATVTSVDALCFISSQTFTRRVQIPAPSIKR